jgi:hypothetical protein
VGDIRQNACCPISQPCSDISSSSSSGRQETS